MDVVNLGNYMSGRLRTALMRRCRNMLYLMDGCRQSRPCSLQGGTLKTAGYMAYKTTTPLLLDSQSGQGVSVTLQRP